MAAERFYLGCYTATSGGNGAGIGVFERSEPGRRWAAVQIAPTDDPSFVALTEGEVHAVSETTAGRVVSFTVSAGELVPASIAASGGPAPCHVTVDPASGSMVVTNYTGGTFAVLSADGLDPARVARVLPLPAGHGPVADRQDAPHAHSSTSTPWGTVLVSDLGTDWIYEVRIDPVTLEPSYLQAHAMPSGSGPRHFAWLGERLLVTGELDGAVHVLDRVEERLVVAQSIAASDSSRALGTGEVLLSHIEVHAGRVYVAVRGRDSIAVLAPSSADGSLALVGEVACGGRWPRHFAFHARADTTGTDLYVANQLSDSVTVLPLADDSGLPGPVVETIETGSPSCVVFA